MTSRKSGSLDTFNLVRLNYYESSLGYKTITDTVALRSFRNFKNVPNKVSIAYKITELLIKNTKEGLSDLDLFDSLYRTLSLLDDGSVLGTAVFAHFLINFMNSLGYSVNLEKCSFCGEHLSRKWEGVWFNPDRGGVVCRSCKSFEREMSLKEIALAREIRKMEEKSYRFLQKDSPELMRVRDLFDDYTSYKLSL